MYNSSITINIVPTPARLGKEYLFSSILGFIHACAIGSLPDISWWSVIMTFIFNFFIYSTSSKELIPQSTVIIKSVLDFLISSIAFLFNPYPSSLKGI